MTIKIGSVYSVTFKSGNTPSAFSWPSKIPDSGNRYMKNKVIKITKKLNPKGSLDYDYVGDVYDKIDGAVELKNIKIVSKQLILKSSTLKVSGKGKKKSKKRSKKRSKKKISRKTRRSYIKKTRKRKNTKKRKMSKKKKKMKGGSGHNSIANLTQYGRGVLRYLLWDKGMLQDELIILMDEKDTGRQQPLRKRIAEINSEIAEINSEIAKIDSEIEKLFNTSSVKYEGDSSGEGSSATIEAKADTTIYIGSRAGPPRAAVAPTPGQGSGGSVEEHPKFQSRWILGKGIVGIVYLVQKIRGKDNGNFYALKELKKEDSRGTRTKEEIRKEAVNERNLLQEVTEKDVPFCTRMHYSFQTLNNYYIVQPYIAGEELFDIQKEYRRFPVKSVIFYAAQITLALEALHELDIVHRDLKPENIMIDSDGYLIVIDLGLAIKCPKVVHDFKITGTHEYFAPEIAIGMVRRTQVEYSKAIDWWALGTIIYELMWSLPPFYDEDAPVMYRKIIGGELEFPKEVFNVDDKTRNARDLIGKLLVRDPDERLTDPKEIKEDPFFSGIVWDGMNTKNYTAPYLPTAYLPTAGSVITFKGLPVEEIRKHDPADLEFEYFEQKVTSTSSRSSISKG